MVTLVRVMWPALLTTPEYSSNPPGWMREGGHSFVIVTAGITQIGQTSVKEFVTEARGPPMVGVSKPVAVTTLVALPVQVSCRVGMKLFVNTAHAPAASRNGANKGRPLVGLSNANGPTRSSMTVTLVNAMSPQFVTYPRN